MKKPLLLRADLPAQSLAEINPSASFESLVTHLSYSIHSHYQVSPSSVYESII